MRYNLYLIVLFSVFLTSCATRDFSNKTITARGENLTGSIEAKAISEIEASQGIVVDYLVGTPVTVNYTVPESLSKYLRIACEGGKLTCKFQDGLSVNLNGRHVIVKVTAPQVYEFEASSNAQINVLGQLSVNKLEIEASSAGMVQMTTVTTTDTQIEANSAGSVSITRLNSESTEIDSSSSGSVSLTGSLGNVSIDASSSAEVKLGGTCSNIRTEASSSATLDATRARIPGGTLNASSEATITVTQATETTYQTSKSSGGKIIIK